MRELRLLLIGRDRGDVALREPSRLVDLDYSLAADSGEVLLRYTRRPWTRWTTTAAAVWG